MMITACVTGLVLIFKAIFMPQASAKGGAKRENLRKGVAKAPAQEEGIQGQCRLQKLQQRHLHGLWWGLKNLLVRKGASIYLLQLCRSTKQIKDRLFQRDYTWILTYLVCPITSPYLGMYSPASEPAVLRWDDDVVSLPPQNLIQWSDLITRLASNLSWAHQKYDCMVQCVIGLRHSPPQLKNQHGLNEEKKI